jgi:hypothetical protein
VAASIETQRQALKLYGAEMEYYRSGNICKGMVTDGQ